jgi:hypothetical protein
MTPLRLDSAPLAHDFTIDAKRPASHAPTGASLMPRQRRSHLSF